MQLDKTDRKLVTELDRNSRASYSEIARGTGISQETVRYRLGKLLESGVIKYRFAVIDYSKLGYTSSKLLLKLQSASDDEIEEVLSFLCKEPSTLWVSRIDGPYEICAVFRTHAAQQLHEALVKISSRFGNLISDRQLSLNIHARYLTRDYLISRNRKKAGDKGYSSGEVGEPLDVTSQIILRLLAADSRISLSAIAEELERNDRVVPLTPEAIGVRIKKLEKTGVINGYHLWLDNSLIGQLHYKVLFLLNAETHAKLADVRAYCERHPRIVFMITALGRWDLELDMEVSSVDECRAIIREISAKFPHAFREWTVLLVTRIAKYNFYS